MDNNWKPIEGFENEFLISESGLIKRLPRMTVYKDGRKFFDQREFLMSPSISKQGYLYVTLSCNGKRSRVFVHRLVAKSFVEGFASNLDVNHKDGCKSNNHYLNLEWVSRSQNIQHAYETGLNSTSSRSKRVMQIDKQGCLIKIWDSTMQIQRELGINNAVISATCLGNNRRKHAHGFKWIYESDHKKAA